MDVRPVDPRDVEVENDEPTYRATVWRPLSNGWSASTYDITGARGVHEVIDWAERGSGTQAGLALHAMAEGLPAGE